MIGGGLSFSGIQLVDDGEESGEGGGIMVQLDYLNKITNVDYDKNLVEVQAGIRIRDLCEELEKYKLALVNMGATATQVNPCINPCIHPCINLCINVSMYQFIRA